MKMMRRYVQGLLLAGLAMSQAGCVRAIREVADNASVPHLSAAIQHATVQVGDLKRTYLLYVPATLSPQAPLVIVFHGSDQDGSGVRRTTGYEFDRLADQHGFVVAYPDGYKGNWDDCRKAASYPARRLAIDDEGFAEGIVLAAIRDQGVDPRKVFALGHSNGGQMALRLALEQPDRFAAIAAISASLPTPDNLDCHAARQPIAAMIINGTADPLNPYEGGTVSLHGIGSRGTVISTMATAKYFAEINGQTEAPHVVRLPHREPSDPTSVERTSWERAGKAPVVLYSVIGGGHVVPQPDYKYPGFLGRQTTDLDAPAAIWQFFAQVTAAH